MSAMREKTIRQLCGRDFDIVKEGLAESQVEDYITELVGERDSLIQRQEHLLSLTKLAEKTVAEADKLAEDIKRETEEEARAKAAKILAKAEQDAQEVAEQKRAEILAIAEKEAQTIKADAQKEVELLVGQHKQRVQEAIKETVEKLHNQLVSELRGMTEHAIALQTEWEGKLREPISESLPPGDDELPSVPVTPEEGEEAAPELTAEADLTYRRDILEQLEKAWVETGANTHSEEQSSTTSSEILPQPDNEKVEGAAEAPAESAAPAASENENSMTYDGTVELDILPPLAPAQLVGIQRYIRDWPGIGIAELKPNDNGYSITIVLDKPMQLIDILKQLPEVEDARERTAGEDGTPADGLKRIAITVSGNS